MVYQVTKLINDFFNFKLIRNNELYCFRSAMRPEGRQGEYGGGSGLSMYPQRPYMGHGSQRGQDGRDQRDIRTLDMRHLPQQADPHATQQQLHHRPPDAKTGERGASNTNPYSHFEKGGRCGY